MLSTKSSKTFIPHLLTPISNVTKQKLLDSNTSQKLSITITLKIFKTLIFLTNFHIYHQILKSLSKIKSILLLDLKPYLLKSLN